MYSYLKNLFVYLVLFINGVLSIFDILISFFFVISTIILTSLIFVFLILIIFRVLVLQIFVVNFKVFLSVFIFIIFKLISFFSAQLKHLSNCLNLKTFIEVSDLYYYQKEFSLITSFSIFQFIMHTI